MPADQTQLVRDSIALANGFFRARLGRELTPVFTVYLYADLEGIAAAYAEKTGNSVERARQLWQTSTAVAQSRGLFVYLGSAGWAQSPETSRTKIIAHEAFHLLQGELAGPQALNSGDTEIPVAGPRWLTEGAAEYVAHRVLAESGRANFETTQARWISVTKTVTAPLSSLEIATGIRGLNGFYDLAPLAASRLIAAVGEGAFITYWEAIGRGAPWGTAFAAAFGKTVQAFYEEFEAYRRTL